MRALLAIDLYENSASTIAVAVSWAARMGATLDLVTASEMTWDADLFAGRDEELEQTFERKLDGIKAVLSRRLPEIPEPMRGEAKAVRGRIASALIDAAKGYDLLIIATHGRKGMERLFAGSVAERVIRSVTCPVLVTRLDAEPVPLSDPLKVIFPVDSEEPNDKAIRWGRRLLGKDHDFRAMYAVPRMATLEEHPYAKWSRERLGLVTVTGGLADIPREIRACTGNPGDEIGRYAAEIGAALIAMPTHTRTVLGRLAFGSVAERVVRVAPCAVLIVR